MPCSLCSHESGATVRVQPRIPDCCAKMYFRMRSPASEVSFTGPSHGSLLLDPRAGAWRMKDGAQLRGQECRHAPAHCQGVQNRLRPHSLRPAPASLQPWLPVVQHGRWIRSGRQQTVLQGTSKSPVAKHAAALHGSNRGDQQPDSPLRGTASLP